MKIRIHLLGNINLICEYPDLNSVLADVKKALKKEELIQVVFPNTSSKFINPNHIIAIEEFVEAPQAAPASENVS